MGTAVIQAVSRGKEAALIQVTKVRLRWSFLGSLALLIVALYLKYVQYKEIWYIFLIAAILYPLVFSFNTFQAFLYGKKQFKKAAIYEITVKLLVGVAVLAALYFTRSLLWIILAWLLVHIIARFSIYRSITRKGLKGTDSKVIHYGWHLSVMQSFEAIAFQIDKLIVPFFLGFESLAIYAIADILPNSVKGATKLSAPLLLPKFTALKGIKVFKQIKSKLFLIFLLSFVIAAVGIFLSPFIIPLFFSESYKVAVPFAQILFASIVFALPTRVFLTLLQARKQVRALYTFNIAYSIVMILSLLILIPKFGLIGACFARLVTRLFSAIHLWIVARSA